MTYADYAFYSGEYMGTVCEDDFMRLAVRASSFLDYYTQGRAAAAADTDPVRLCCCALVDVYAGLEAARALAKSKLTAAAEGEDIKSETVGSYSRTLATCGESALAALNVANAAKTTLAETCARYLAHTGLLYRGRRCGKCTPPTP